MRTIQPRYFKSIFDFSDELCAALVFLYFSQMLKYLDFILRLTVFIYIDLQSNIFVPPIKRRSESDILEMRSGGVTPGLDKAMRSRQNHSPAFRVLDTWI